MYTLFYLYRFLVNRGFKFIVTHVRHSWIHPKGIWSHILEEDGDNDDEKEHTKTEEVEQECVGDRDQNH